MNWEKSKTIVVWLLVALNCYLLFVNAILKTSYDIKGEQEKSIIELLDKNGISTYDEIDIEYKPLAPLNILATPSDVNENAYLTTFFSNPEITRENYKIIATENSKYLNLENGFITLEIANEEDYYEYTGELLDFIKGLDDSYEHFVLDKKFKDGDADIYEFREKYNDKIIFTNELSVRVVDNKIVQIVGFYGKAMESRDKAREIVSIDMVLYTVMEYAKEAYVDKHLFITGVDLVYYQEEYSDYNKLNTAKAIPCYRIYLEGEQVPIIISAYENKIAN